MKKSIAAWIISLACGGLLAAGLVGAKERDRQGRVTPVVWQERGVAVAANDCTIITECFPPGVVPAVTFPTPVGGIVVKMQGETPYVCCKGAPKKPLCVGPGVEGYSLPPGASIIAGLGFSENVVVKCEFYDGEFEFRETWTND